MSSIHNLPRFAPLQTPVPALDDAQMTRTIFCHSDKSFVCSKTARTEKETYVPERPIVWCLIEPRAMFSILLICSSIVPARVEVQWAVSLRTSGATPGDKIQKPLTVYADILFAI